MEKIKLNENYKAKEIEEKWAKIWEENGIYSLKSTEDKPKYYVLEMFPYPSGEPHMGHARNYTIGDVLARVLARKGYNVLHPIGYDAFGLPAENAAIKSGIHPKDSTMANIDKMRKALKRMGISYEFEDEIITCEADYYKWTQWFFLLFYKMGLAEKKKAKVNWCNSCQTVLANEQVISGRCERCDSEVTKRVLSQWFFKITEYAQRLLDDMELLEGGWPERVLTIQRNWIGRSEGAVVNFKLLDDRKDVIIPVFTTRPDTLYGVTFFIIAPEHPLVDEIVTESNYRRELEKVREIILKQSDIERSSTEVEKIGCFTGRYVINPLNGEKVPIWIANYVLLEYGTGAIMAVPAHDERDFEFAQKYNIPVREVISPDGKEHEKLDKAYIDEGIMINSGIFSGTNSVEGRKRIVSYLEENNVGKFTVNYKLKDWLISRQRYWGAPIPIVYCDKCGTVPVPEEDLPVLLPYNVDFRPTGMSPLAYSEEFVNTICPKCSGRAKRETDTMDTFVCSSWYFLRYCSPHYQKAPFSRAEVDYWMPVDQYIGGIEHATMHLIYARFFTKVLYDAGLVNFKEPFIKYFPHGVVNLGGQKMSKSKGNIINPSRIYNKYGADTLRLYILFIGPADSIVDWSDSGVEGANRFLGRFWRLVIGNIGFIQSRFGSGLRDTGKGLKNPDDKGTGPANSGSRREVGLAFNSLGKSSKSVESCNIGNATTNDINYININDIDVKLKNQFMNGKLSELEKELYRKLHQTIKKVTQDVLDRFSFNTAISAIMELVNLMYKYNDSVSDDKKNISLIKESTEKLLILLSPIAPFITEELWSRMGGKGSIHRVPWPTYDEEIAKEELVTIIFQVNGKLRDRKDLPVNTPPEEIEKEALGSEKVRKFIGDKKIVKKIVVPNRLINIVVQDK